MKDILRALIRVAYSRIQTPPPISSLILFAAVICLLFTVHKDDNRLAFFEDLAHRQAQQLAEKDVIDYHVDTTHEDPDGGPPTDEGPRVVTPTAPVDVSAHLPYTTHEQIGKMRDRQDASWAAHHPVEKHKGKSYEQLGKEKDRVETKTIYQLCRANHGTRSQCKAESKPIVWPVVVGPAQIVPGDVTFIFHAGTAGGWKCPAHSPEPFPENCTFVPDYDAAYGYGHASDEGPMFATHEEEFVGSPATPSQQEDMTLIGIGSSPIQTSGPMPVKACDGEHCEVVNGQWYPLDGKPLQVWQRETNQER